MNHQKPVSTTRPMTASRTGPPAPRSAGPAQPARAEQPTSTASQISRRSMSLAPRPSSSKAASYRPWIAVAAAMPPRMKNTQAVPVMALEVAAEEVNRPPTSAAACLFRPRCRASPVAADRPARALAMIRNGNKHNSSVAANSMPRLMKSIESSRRHRCSAGDPAYFPLATSIFPLAAWVRCRTRWRAPRPPSAATRGDSLSWPADAISLRLVHWGPAAQIPLPAPGGRGCRDHCRWRHPALIRPQASSRPLTPAGREPGSPCRPKLSDRGPGSRRPRGWHLECRFPVLSGPVAGRWS